MTHYPPPPRPAPEPQHQHRPSYTAAAGGFSDHGLSGPGFSGPGPSEAAAGEPGFGGAAGQYGSAHPAVPPHPEALTASPAPVAWSAASFGSAESVDVRCAAIMRMREANIRHATLAWDRRRNRPLSPYALGLIYTYPDVGRRGRHTVAAATRVWKLGPESQSMAHLLYNYHLYLAQLGEQGPLDVRTQMTYSDEMPDGAAYTGLGLSSLDTHTGTWEEVLRTAEYVDDIPGRISMIMSGGMEPGQVLIVCSRRGRSEFDIFNVQSTRASEMARLSTGNLWPGIGDADDDTFGGPAPATAEQLTSNPRNKAFALLRPLHETLCRLDNARLVQAGHRYGGRHGR